MKNKILITIILSIFLLGNANAENEAIIAGNTTNENINLETQVEGLENEIENIEISGEKEIKINLKEYLKFENGVVNGNFKVLREGKSNLALKDEVNSKIVHFKLNEDLNTNSTYNLLAIQGVNASIDFSTKDSLENQIVKNEDELEENDIDFIQIVDKNNIELHFKTNLTTNDFDFKIFEIINIIEKKGFNENETSYIKATVAKKINPNNSYMLTVLSLKNKSGEEITFNNGGYKEFGNNELTQLLKEEKENINNNDIETNNTALNTEQTPDTGPTTNILIILTFILSVLYFIATNRRKV